MAPPIPGTRRPAAPPRRKAGDMLVGLVALLALAVLVLGVPAALVKFFGLPIPHSLPGSSIFTSRLDISAIFKILAVVVWLAWLQLVWCVVVEVAAAVRNVGMPAQVPLAGGTQALVNRLVTAALLLFAATAALSPSFTHSAAPPPRPAVVAAASPHATSDTRAATAPTTADSPGAPTVTRRPEIEKIYVVRPPVGRFHQSLWEIAATHLGDGRRYHEIFEMNKDQVQPDGTRLTIASLIRPGWILKMPADAHGPGIEIVRHVVTDDQQAPAVAAHVPAPRQPTRPARQDPGHDRRAQQAATSRYPDELAAASLLAAGVLAALGRRRREQLWRRAFGSRVAAPGPDAALAEAALRLGAAEPSARLLDSGLRQLSNALAAAGKSLPNVFAAHVGAAELDLWVAPADPWPPAPWQAVSDGQVWRLPFTAEPALRAGQASGVLAPFPGLVTIGSDDTGTVLVDLEAAAGLIAVTGPPEQVQAALAAVAVELVTNLWSDRMQVVLVGFGSELTALAPERVTAVPTLAQALPRLEARASEAEAALAVSGMQSVLTGRLRGVDSDAWLPQYVIIAEPPAPAELKRLVALTRTANRTGAGYVLAGQVPEAAWTWEVTPDARLRAGVLGFDVRAQLLPAHQYAAVVELFRAATAPASVPAARPAADAAPAAQLLPGAKAAVAVTLLGTVGVRAPGRIDPERLALATEVVAYLALRRAAVHPQVLASAIWPRGVTADVVEATVTRVRDWLGTDEAGRLNLVTDAEGRLRLGAAVRVDWNVFRALVARAAEPGDQASYLERALAEVSGRLLDGRPAGHYAWLATTGLEQEAPALVADAAHGLSGMLRAAGDADGAMAAARQGLRLAADDELLWRDLLLAADATGDEQVLRAVVDEVSARALLDDRLPRIAPETEALIEELLPSWRPSVA